MKECEECEGKGELFLSCCGDDISFNLPDCDLCPTCGEHCGDEGEECDACGGTGIDPNAKIQVTSRHYIITESKSHPNMYIFKSRKTNSYFLMESYPEYVLSMQE